MSDAAPDIIRISPNEAHAKMTNEGYVYVDVRTIEEFEDGHPAGAVNIPLGDDFASAMSQRYAKDAAIIVGCKGGVRSMKAARALALAGFTRVLEQRAGWDAARGSFGEIVEPGWSRAGLPSE